VVDGLVVAVVRVGDGRVEAVVAVEAGLVVAVVAVGAVVDEPGAVVDAPGAVVTVDGAEVEGLEVAEPARSVSMAAIEDGLGTDAPEGTKATVMSCPSASLMALGS
jgi:hypothetical protein